MNKKQIEEVVNVTVLKLKMAGLMRDDRKSAFQKTEALLRNYNTFKNVTDRKSTKQLVKKIEIALDEIKGDIYYDIIPMIYFENRTREDIAEHFNTSTKTITRNKNKLVNQLKLRLFSDDVIFELFL